MNNLHFIGIAVLLLKPVIVLSLPKVSLGVARVPQPGEDIAS